MSMERVLSPTEWVDKVKDDLPPGLMTDALASALVEYLKASLITEGIMQVVSGSSVPNDVSVRESSFMFTLMRQGGTETDVESLIRAGLASRDSMSTFRSLRDALGGDI